MLATAKDGRNYSQEPPELQLVRAKCIDNTQLISCNYSCRNMGSVLLRLHFRKFPQKFASCVCISERRRRGVEALRLTGISRVNLAASRVNSKTSNPGVVKRTPTKKLIIILVNTKSQVTHTTRVKSDKIEFVTYQLAHARRHA